MGRNSLLNKLRGFQKAPRGRFLWLVRKQLTHEELALYELGIAITDWDKTHTETYGSFDATNQELSDILGWKSDTTAGRHKKSLIDKKIFLERADGRIEAKGFEKWQLRQSLKATESTAKIKEQDANVQDEDAKIEEKQPQNDNYSLGSFKGSINVSEVISDEELTKISDEIDSQESQKSAQLQKTVGQMSSDEQLGLCKSVFGEETEWRN